MADLDIDYLKSMAESGDLDCMAELGCCYVRGDEVPADYDKAYELFAKCAAKDFVPGIFFLGSFFEDIRSDNVSALQHYERAAEAGHPEAQRYAADLHFGGKGIVRNYQRAVYWYHRAAENNVPEAQFVLGELYRTGSHVELNTATSLDWYRRAAAQGYQPAQGRIDQYFPDSAFRDSRTKPPASEVTEKYAHVDKDLLIAETQSLSEELTESAQQNGFLPKDEYPFIRELRPYSRQVVQFVCGYINDDMKTKGFDAEELVPIFEYVLVRAFDLAYQWHKSSDGKIDETITVGNPFHDDEFLQLPLELRTEIRKIPAPRIICFIMYDWLTRHNSELQEKGIAIWTPLSLALSHTFDVGISLALQMFGYRQNTSEGLPHGGHLGDRCPCERHLQSGLQLAQTGRIEEAIREYDRAIAVCPENYKAWGNRGICLDQLGHGDQAIASYERAIELEPHYAFAWNNKGTSLARAKKDNDALTCFLNAIKAKPDYLDALINAGMVLINLGRFETAVQYLDRAIQLAPNNAKARNKKGLALHEAALRNKSALKPAIECFREALKFDPESADIWNNLGTVLLDAGQCDAAIRPFETALKLSPGAAHIRHNLNLAKTRAMGGPCREPSH